MPATPKPRKRRVSFSLPPKEEPDEPDTLPTPVSISVQDNGDFDDDVETPVDLDNSDSESSDAESQDAPQREDGSDGDDNDADDDDEDDDEMDVDVETANGNHENSSQESGDESDDDESDEEHDITPLQKRGKPAKPVIASASGDSSAASSDDDGSDDSDDDSDGAGSNAPEAPDTKAATTPIDPADAPPPPVATFAELSLDPRLDRAVEREGWRKPTPVQAAVIPAALAGRDVLVSAPTGSGKTGAYLVPLLHFLSRPRPSAPSPAPAADGEASASAPATQAQAPALRAAVLVPTRELVHQVAAVCKRLARFVHGLRVAALAPTQKKRAAARTPLALAADVVVGTPASVAALREPDGANPLRGVEFVVVDEADLVLSYGYEADAREALSRIPTSAQSMLLSATLEADGMDAFRKVILRRPLTVKVTTDGNVEDGDPTGASHYFSQLKNTRDRYLVTFAMLRLGVICGKVLIFVNHINSAFKLKLFLDQFKIKSAVLNSELPANSRIHCVEQFNAGIFDILIATDECQKDVKSEKDSKAKGKESKKRKRVERDEEFGLARGVDFRNVAAVLNFDTPETAMSYTHRAGRTARGGKSGTVLTLACSDKDAKDVTEMCRDIGVHVGPLAFQMHQVEVFRYRVEDCLRLVTDTAVNGARLADVRRELMNAETLKDYFDDNPDDLDALQHNMRLAQNVPEHLGHIPSYLVPAGMRETVEKTGVVRGKKGRRDKGKRRKVSANGKKADPLKGFSVSGSSRQRYQAKHGIKKRKSKDPGQGVMKRKRKW